MSARDGAVRPPAGLSPSSRRHWRDVCDAYEMSSADLRVLEVGCRAHDRAEECRAVVDREGPVVVDRFNQQKPHPLLVEERQWRDLERRSLATLGLEDGGEPLVGARMPRRAR